MRHFKRTILVSAVLFVALPLLAQSDTYDQQTQATSEAKQDLGQRANRSGNYEGININDNTVMISGKAYKTPINPSRVPTLANSNSMPLMMIPDGTRIDFHVDADGRLTAVWVNGDMTQ
ncbi:MAG: hypothetical protein KKC01_10685 [Gammaproteobacteria bacterium]|nr:hypothetical protein [Gammaproteobacteria bacterium]